MASAVFCVRHVIGSIKCPWTWSRPRIRLETDWGGEVIRTSTVCPSRVSMHHGRNSQINVRRNRITQHQSWTSGITGSINKWYFGVCMSIRAQRLVPPHSTFPLPHPRVFIFGFVFPCCPVALLLPLPHVSSISRTCVSCISCCAYNRDMLLDSRVGPREPPTLNYGTPVFRGNLGKLV
jgi:hypothetical protein